MAITINNGVQNINGTPGAISGVFSDRPAAANVAEGTLYFATDTAAIYQAVAGSWVNYAGGGGGSSTGINGLNGTTNIGLGGTLLNATAIDAANFSFEFNTVKTFNVIDDTATPTNFEIGNGIIQTFSGIIQVGLKLDFANGIYNFGNFNSQIGLSINEFGGQIDLNFGGVGLQMTSSGRFTTLGDGVGAYNATSLIIDDTNQRIQTSNSGFAAGIDFLFDQNLYLFGDFAFKNNGQRFVINDADQQVYTSNAGIFINNSTLKTTIGDYDANNNGTQFIVDDANTVIKTKYLNNDEGLKLDFQNDVYKFGDYNFNTNGSQIVINNTTGRIYTDSSIFGEYGLNIYQYGSLFQLGDYDAIQKFNGNVFIVDDGASKIFTKNQGNENGLKLDFLNNVFQFGDFGVSSYALTINAATAQANLFCSTITLLTGNASGFGASGNQTSIGDVDGAGNSTIFGVDDNLETLVATNVITNLIGALAGNNLKIRINGNDYVIPLYNAGF